MSDEIIEILERAKRAQSWNERKAEDARETGRLVAFPALKASNRSNGIGTTAPAAKVSSRNNRIVFTSSGALVAVRTVAPTPAVEAINRYRSR